MSREVVVNCEGACGVQMTLLLTPEKAEGGFYACDIDHELNECGWIVRGGKEFCERCSPSAFEGQK